MTIAGTSIRPEANSKMVTEDSPLVARVRDFSGLENGFIVLSASDVQIGGSLNPDAAGNQKFAIAAAVVNGTVSAQNLGTLRAYLVNGTEVLQRCGQVVIAEPSPDPRLTALTAGGTSILTQGASKQIDENAALAGTIINRSELTSGFVVLSASSVAVGGTLNPDAAGNQKFAIAADSISGTIDASSVGTLHAYLVDGTNVLQKCGDVVIVAPVAGVSAFVAGGTDLLSQAAAKNISDGNLSGTYDAAHMNLLTNPRIVYSSSLNIAVGSQVVGADGFNAASGSAQAFSLSGIADGSFRFYLIDATTAGGNTGNVVQVMGTITKAATTAAITAAKVQGQSILNESDSSTVFAHSAAVIYSSVDVDQLSHPRIVASTNADIAVGAQVTADGGFDVTNGSDQTGYTSPDVAYGTRRLYLIDASAEGGLTGSVIQRLGKINFQSMD